MRESSPATPGRLSRAMSDHLPGLFAHCRHAILTSTVVGVWSGSVMRTRRMSIVVVATLLATLVIGGVPARSVHADDVRLASFPSSAQVQPVTLPSTGDLQTFTVPAGIAALKITAIGGAGGSAGSGVGGRAASVTGTVSVQPDDVLAVAVGGMGASGSNGSAGIDGGPGGGAGGGGGASWVWKTAGVQNESAAQMYADLTPSSVLAVAGGGGGAAAGHAGGDATVPADTAPGAFSAGSAGDSSSGGTGVLAGDAGSGGSGGSGGGGGSAGHGGVGAADIAGGTDNGGAGGGGAGGGGAGIASMGGGGTGGAAGHPVGGVGGGGGAGGAGGGGTATTAGSGGAGGGGSAPGGCCAAAGGDGSGGPGGLAGLAGGSGATGGQGGRSTVGDPGGTGGTGGAGGYGGGGGGAGAGAGGGGRNNGGGGGGGAGGGGGGYGGGGGGGAGGGGGGIGTVGPGGNADGAGGGGGGSFNGGTRQVNVAGVGQGDGSVTITPIPLRVVILAPGVDPNLSATTFDPYARASSTFSTLLDVLSCRKPQQQPSDSPLVACDDPTLKWAPYSYVGATSSEMLEYLGDDTGQPLNQSITSMNIVYNFLQDHGARGARFFVVGHSLGGAVAGAWGAGHPEARVITLDSPVAGIWPVSSELFFPSAYGAMVFPKFYCSSALSTGLWDATNAPPLACNRMLASAVVDSAIVRDLHAAGATEGLANAINFANSADILVPSWFALNPGVPGGQVLIDDRCGKILNVGANWLVNVATNHACVLDNPFVLGAVAGVIDDDPNSIWGQRHDAPPEITLHITAWHKGAQVPVQAVGLARAGSDGSIQRIDANLVGDGAGGMSTTVPWIDLMVQASASALRPGCKAVLPAAPVTRYEVRVNVGGGPGACPTDLLTI